MVSLFRLSFISTIGIVEVEQVENPWVLSSIKALKEVILLIVDQGRLISFGNFTIAFSLHLF